MAIYDFKEFLDIEDVAEYLADKGIGNFNTNNPRNCYKLHNFLKELVVSGKLNLVFRYYGRVNLYDENFMNDPRPFSEKIDIFRNPESLTLLFDDDMLGDWLSKSTLYNQGNNYRHDFYIDNRHYFRPYELFEYECNASDSRERPSFILLDDNNRGWAGVEPLFPKAQLDTIFNQPSKADLENKISMLEQRAKMTNDNYKSIEFRTGGVDTCIYIDDLHDKITAKDDIIAEQAKQIAELQKQLEQKLAMQNSTPADVEKPIYTNTALTALFDVMNTYWQNPEQPPKQEFIKQWIVEKYPSIDPSKALWIDKIIRHQDQK
ncbi:hypothetical protein [Moraxella bovoculi]|uniref:hypothetical protein n=1 Tax=Moraxella bovoculi TaxID=386891 RepID=UPI0009BC2195|nr:hypothetical protein [Moraxella bovoculi]AXR99005.1 hypothetical protein AAX10_10100 [Moraxella bovoculi]